jgi:hypothetical protein
MHRTRKCAAKPIAAVATDLQSERVNYTVLGVEPISVEHPTVTTVSWGRYQAVIGHGTGSAMCVTIPPP